MNNLKMKVVTTAVILAASISTANAALPEAAQAAFDSLKLTIEDMIAATWPVLITLVLGVAGLTLFKMLAAKLNR
jgi:hypothetical protein